MKKMAIKIIPVIIIVVSTFFYLFLFNACKKKETLLNSPKLVRKIFGRPDKIEDSGVISVEYEPPNCVTKKSLGRI